MKLSHSGAYIWRVHTDIAQRCLLSDIYYFDSHVAMLHSDPSVQQMNG